MLDNESTGDATSDATTSAHTAAPRRPRRAASRPAGPPQPATDEPAGAAESSTGSAAAETSKAAATPKRRRTTKKAAAEDAPQDAGGDVQGAPTAIAEAPQPVVEKPARRTRKRALPAQPAEPGAANADAAGDLEVDDERTAQGAAAGALPAAPGAQPPVVLFQPPDPVAATAVTGAGDVADEPLLPADLSDDDEAAGDDSRPRRRRRGGRGRRPRGRGPGEGGDTGDGSGRPDDDDLDAAARPSGPSQQGAGADPAAGPPGEADESAGEPVQTDDDEGSESGATRRRRRRRRRGTGEEPIELTEDDPPDTVVRVREPRKTAKKTDAGRADAARDGDSVRAIKGSTRLEAKKQRRRDGRDAGRKRPSIISEAEFLARRESVDRVMVVRQSGDVTQIGVLEDGVLVEHYVSSASAGGMLGNVYLGKVQNVLPSMEAAFVDIGKGRNAVLYAGEVNWDAAGLDGQPRRIELALKSGDPVLAQVTKDAMGHKGARLTSQVSLPGRYLVYVPGNPMTGISRKLPDTERSRLKSILKKVVPEDAGVIVRTAAEGATEDELARDVARLTAQWEDIQKKAKTASPPALLYGEPDLMIRVVRDVFNEDFAKLIVSGDDAWDVLDAYVGHVAPDLHDRLSRWTSEEDVFAAHRVDEQLAKALDRKVWLPSGGYLVIDRTEAMTVVDVNTGKFTGQGGNLEETVTKNNIEAAEEIVRQLRLRDIGGIIVIDFIDMVLESNRDLVLRRMLECLGRDRTKHQVAEVTSLGLVQMTRKRVGQGLFEAFSETCESCSGRGVHVRTEPILASPSESARGGRSSGKSSGPAMPTKPSAAKGAGSAKVGGAPKPAPPSVSPVALEDPVEPHDRPLAGDDDAAARDLAENPDLDVPEADVSDPGVPDVDGSEAPDNSQEAPGSAPPQVRAPARRRRRAAGSV